MEITSGATFASDWIAPLRHWAGLASNDDALPPWIRNGGARSYEREGCHVIGRRDLATQ